MCTLCAALRPADPLAATDQHLTGTHRTSWDMEMLAGGAGSGGINAVAPPFTMSQIADQLTDGAWEADGEGRRAFDLGPDRTLTVDLSGLSVAAVRDLTMMSLEAWTDVSGIRFVEFVAPDAQIEVSDAAADIGTTSRVTVGTPFEGSISSIFDADYIRVRLQAGQPYTISADTTAESIETLDPYLQLLDETGASLIADDDSGSGLNSLLTFTAETTGNYYVAVSPVEGQGDYVVRVAEQGGASSADITFADNDPEGGAFSTSDVEGSTILSSFINLQQDWDPDAISVNSYWFQTMVHEIGHALGLGHAGNYNGTATWPDDGLYANDSWQATIMSYFAQGDGSDLANPGFSGTSVNPNIGADYAYLATLMPADIIAIQNLYGTNFSTRSGNTVYGANSNVGGYLGQLMDQAFGDAAATTRIFIDNPVALTIYDTGGRDALDFSTFSVAQRINLNVGSFSNVAGFRENLQIGRGVVIEDAIGGRGADRLIGNGANNTLRGNAGADSLEGGVGRDVLNGGVGRDRLDGGIGRDTASYASARAGVTVDLLNNAANTGDARGDVLISIASVRGSSLADRLLGNEHSNTLQGFGGADALGGRAGDDQISGGKGADTVGGGADNDTLWGGTGTDLFQFNDGADRIRDFRNDVDTLGLNSDLWGGGNRSVARILADFAVDTGRDVVLFFGSGNNIRIEGLASINLLSNDISII